MKTIDKTRIMGRPAEILLIEDNRSDAVLVRKAFEVAKILNIITVARGGAEALAMRYGKK